MPKLLNCPSCGAGSGFGSDEDGYPDCHICGGPHRCPECNDWAGDDDLLCLDCGESLHDECKDKHELKHADA